LERGARVHTEAEVVVCCECMVKILGLGSMNSPIPIEVWLGNQIFHLHAIQQTKFILLVEINMHA
jgi:hypothetical protein